MSDYDAIHDIDTTQTLENTKLRNKLNELEHKNAELTKERDELVAHCEKLTGILDDLSKLHAADVFVKEPWEMTFEMVNTLLQQTQKQSLANIQADAIEGLKESIKWFGYNKSIATQIEEYINQLREQSKNA